MRTAILKPSAAATWPAVPPVTPVAGGLHARPRIAARSLLSLRPHRHAIERHFSFVSFDREAEGPAPHPRGRPEGRGAGRCRDGPVRLRDGHLSLIHISEPTRR